MTSVNGIMSQENRTRNTAVGAGVGAVAGAGVGYLTKQIAKDGVLANDVFQKVVEEVENANKTALEPFKAIDELAKAANTAQEAATAAAKAAAAETADDATKAAATAATEAATAAANKLKAAQEQLLKNNNVEIKEGDKLDDLVTNLRNGIKTTNTANITLAGNKSVTDALEAVTKAENKTSAMQDAIRAFQKTGIEIEGADKKAVENALKETPENVDDVFKAINGAVEAGKGNRETFAGKVKGCFEENSKKLKDKFEEGSEKIGESIKKVMKSAKLKQAAIIGGITAAVLGLGAFLLSNKKADKANKQ